VTAQSDPVRAEINLARRKWHGIPAERLAELRELVRRYHLSVFLGDVTSIESKWYVTHAGLLRLAQRKHCSGIETTLERRYSVPSDNRWVFKATVFKSPCSRGFVGYGDADPSNVSSVVHGAEMRVAETRAVNRALRKAYGIGLCSVEELAWSPRVTDSKPSGPATPKTAGNNGRGSGHHNGQPRLRDRLCLLIRRHGLDANLVKAYAADYCGTASLRDATRDQIESLICHLAERAAKDRDGLLCHLNSYPKTEEVTK
jgi:hypothetical protein